MELTIYWFTKNVRQVLALKDTGVKLTLLYGNPQCFIGPTTHTEGYGSLQHGPQGPVDLVTELAPYLYDVYVSWLLNTHGGWTYLLVLS